MAIKVTQIGGVSVARGVWALAGLPRIGSAAGQSSCIPGIDLCLASSDKANGGAITDGCRVTVKWRGDAEDKPIARAPNGTSADESTFPQA